MSEASGRPFVLLHLGWPRDRELVRSLLVSAGLDARPAPAQPELKQLVGDGRIDLLLADTKAGRGPLDDLVSIVAEGPDPDLPLIILAEAGGVEALAELVLARPSSLLLAKPVAPGQLRAAVAAGLRDRAGRRRERELLRKLSEANSELREAGRRKDEFLAMLAHELRNPLAAIGNAVRVAAIRRQEEQYEWSMDVVGRQMKHLAHIIDDLLDVARIDRGKIELRREVVDVTPLLESAINTVRPLVEARQHELLVSIESGGLWANVDSTRFEQVVVNLLNNAAKYSENGGHVALSARNVGGEVAVSVKDRGTGIPPEKLPQMFELFSQGDRSLGRSEGGLGIGLTVVKKLVELHGGAVEATSEGPGRGSEFTVRLPSAARPKPEMTASSGRHDSAGKAARILVVDDSEDTARGMARLLKLLGHDVAIAHSGPEAIELAGLLRPEYVLLDIGLPGMDGYEIAARLRQEEGTRGAVIIAVSGYGQEGDRRRSKEAGFDHHLIKPLDHDALLSLIAGGPNVLQ